MYNTIINEQTFLNFGSKKIILVTGETLSGIEISCHPNVYIDNNTTFEEYWDVIKDKVLNIYSDSLMDSDTSYRLIDNIFFFNVKIWNADSISNKNIKITRSTLKSNKHFNKLNIRKFHTSSINNILLKPLKF